jgi:CHAT domain-containing protein
MLGVQASLANLYWCQAFLHHLLGDEQKSESTYQRALTIAESSEHGDSKAAMDVTLYLGLLYQTQGRWDEAMIKYEQASFLAQRLSDKHLSALIHYRRGNLFKYQKRIDEAFAAYEQAITLIRTLRITTESEEIKIGLLGTTQQVFEAMVLLCLEQDHPVDAFNYVERARSRAFLDTLIKKSPELYDALDQPVATLAEVQARLPANAVLVEYFTTGVLPRGEHMINNIPATNTRLREHLTQPARTIIFVVTREQFDVHVADLNPNTLRPQLYDPGPGRRFLHGRLPAYLYERILQPVQHVIAGRDQLFLVPHGPLHYVPFMALHSPAGDHLLRADGPAIALAPSATILLHNCLNRPTKRADGLLALGYNDPRVGLQYAESEARGVARLMNGVAWTGPAPKRDHLLTASPHARWIHIAGHAVYNPHDPLASALQLGVDDSLSARLIIAELELKADLVTLSACTTGVSSVVPGDELLGLQRALLYAGAPTVVCTLWEAHDLAALLVMEQFYAHLGSGRSPAAALRDAQVAVRDMSGRAVVETLERWQQHFPEEASIIDPLLPVFSAQPDVQPFADPFYWAPFMLIGRP